MKILTINSSAMYKKGNDFFIYKETGRLFENITKKFKVETFHFWLPVTTNESLANFNISKSNIDISTVERKPGKLKSYFQAYVKLFFRLKDSDFLYLFYPNSFYFSAFISFLLGKPYALYVRGEKGLKSRRSIFLFRNAKFILTVSPYFTEEIKSFNKNVFTIKPMIPFSLEDSPEGKSTRSEGVLKILYVGRIERAKGVFELVDAVKKLKDSGEENFVVNLIGDGESYEEINALVNQLDLQNDVILRGPIYDAGELKENYIDNDIFILPTHHEGFPRVLYEAMIFKLAIITTFVGSISHLMKENENCLQISVNDSSDIQAKLKELIKSETLRKKIIDKGSETITNYVQENNRTHEELFFNLIS